MPHQLSQLTGIIATIATIALVQPTIASAKTSVEIGETARAITVLINEPDSVGSGVILQQQGDIYTVLTAAHVVKNKVSYQITTSDDRSYQVISNSIRSAPGNIDLAVIKFKSTTKYPTAKLGNSNVLRSGMDLYVGGFPSTSRAITELVFVFREGKVSANSNKTFDRGYSLVYSNDTLPGMSGGAVLNSEGELVAIHGRGDRDENNVKTGFNLGIPVNRFATIASNMGVDLGGQVATIPPNTSPRADDYFASAAQKYATGDYRGTLTDLDRAIALNPQSVNAYIGRGMVKYQQLNDPQGALADLNRAIAIDSKVANAYNNRGVLKAQKLNDARGGLADLDRSIAIDPKFALAYNNRGNLKYQQLNDVQGALADLDRSIALDPQVANTYYNRAVLKSEKLNDVRGTLADLDRAIALNPKYTFFYYYRGNLKAQKLNDVQGAITDLSQAIALNPKFANAYNNRGFLKAQNLNDFSGALADLNRAISIDPQYASAYFNRAMIKAKQNNIKGAISDMQQAAKLYQQQGKQQDARDAIARIKQWQQTSNNSGSF
ncbi:tetratricopeptide repeat protein [Chamaesiphon minutus]|uniref:Trypsin-like serine protease with C-terminal PDZ domain n=1 Tax=Chamaesiphon minutus (strain ATCC 27169 / PCC 6605) TaxID=1173020 RepID=K9UL00_CHAP6|nr:tetratricopeptide repeat protein [Chamaesiphon minutus]AFY95323.1 trypsin-like serine protease with C-terminal PDZ domain [Chamaesiphon minutus PCC 6605]